MKGRGWRWWTTVVIVGSAVGRVEGDGVADRPEIGVDGEGFVLAGHVGVEQRRLGHARRRRRRVILLAVPRRSGFPARFPCHTHTHTHTNKRKWIKVQINQINAHFSIKSQSNPGSGSGSGSGSGFAAVPMVNSFTLRGGIWTGIVHSGGHVLE